MSPFHAIGLAWAFATTSGASAMSKPSDKPKPTHLTTQFGAPVPNNQDSLTAGPPRPLLSQDVWLHEKLGNLVREVIPERRMHRSEERPGGKAGVRTGSIGGAP